MNQQQLNKEVERTKAELERIETALCERIRKTRIIPFCEARGCRFVAGMGGFSFHHADDPPNVYAGCKYDDDDSRKSDKQWQSLYALLTTEIPWRRSNDFGSMCEYYTASTYREN